MTFLDLFLPSGEEDLLPLFFLAHSRGKQLTFLGQLLKMPRTAQSGARREGHLSLWKAVVSRGLQGLFRGLPEYFLRWQKQTYASEMNHFKHAVQWRS